MFWAPTCNRLSNDVAAFDLAVLCKDSKQFSFFDIGWQVTNENGFLVG